MSIEWKNLRPLAGSQNTAYEELCCQLASSEQAPQGSRFIRKGVPDAGVECFWLLPNGEEWAWQAKFFGSLEKAQWQQLDESVRRALDKHPQLTSYTICLPLDRRDPRIRRRKDLMDQWNERVAQWKDWAREKAMSVEFGYWGEHEIWQRLSTEQHRGRYFFWFNKEFFAQQWFSEIVSEAIANAGPRYTPEIHVGLAIADLFDGLGRTEKFYSRINDAFGATKIAYSKLRIDSPETQIATLLGTIREHAERLFPFLQNVEHSGVETIDFETVTKLAFQINEASWECSRISDEIRRSSESSTDATRRQSDLGYLRHLLSQLANTSAELGDLTGSHECRLANLPALLLVGNAGTGKSHLFCDVAKHRVEAGLPTVLLLGENFSDEDPWSQIIRMLGLRCSRADFLGALEASAQASNGRAIILIDALNEGHGRTLWRRQIAGMLNVLSRYPRIGLALSVRSSYEDTVIPEGLVPERMVREEHAGFADHEYEATTTFFAFYGIKAPSVPLLNPEFQNPLFLKLFCKGLKNAGHTEMPVGLEGVTAVFDFFIESVNSKLSQEHLLDFDPVSQPVQKAIDDLAVAMTERGQSWLPREEALRIINAYLPDGGWEKSLFRNLVAEGVIAEDRSPTDIGRNAWVDNVHFAYERLSDHLITKRMLAEHFDGKDPSNAFAVDQPLGALVKDQVECWRNRGIVEALCIQLPERSGKELFEHAPQCAEWRPALEAFVDSLIWRRPDATSDATLKYVNEFIITSKDLHYQFLDALLTVSSNPKHHYNANFLHKNLEVLSLPDRDAWWSIYLHERYVDSEHGAVHRLIDWAWSAADKSHIDNKSLLLCATALFWFLTTSNRFVRDRATKALVALLTPRINLLKKLLVRFHKINDPYVTERLYAVAYGCALRSNNKQSIAELAVCVYKLVFEDKSPPVHILLRDYARGVIEAAIHRGSKLRIDVRRIRPPYGSEWSDEIPSKAELEKEYDTWTPDRSDNEIAQSEIVHSVIGHEDFARYVIGTNWGHFDWTSRRSTQAATPTRLEIYEQFVSSLTVRQKEAFDRLSKARDNFDIYLRMDEERRRETFSQDLTEELFRIVLADLENRVRKSLGKRKLKTFDEHVLPCLADPLRCRSDNHFDLSLAQRWILQRVFQLGWTKERFGYFDRTVNRGTTDYRTAHKPERIGKKYQWMAFHEFLARVADNFEYRSPEWSDHKTPYNGPWQPSERDIDPSCLLKSTGREVWKHRTNTWWFPARYRDWGSEWTGGDADLRWLRRSDDVPFVESLIDLVNIGEGSRWLMLDAYYQWEQPVPIGQDPSDTRRKHVWYIIHGYAVRRTDIDELFEWGKQQDFFGRWMPESHALSEVFMGEFFWAPAYRHFNVPYFHRTGWTRGYERIPKEVLLCAEEYSREDSGFDCSMDEGYSFYLPTKWIADGMNLRWNGVDGHFFDATGDLIAFDPSVKQKGPSALLLNKDKFLQFLHDSGCDLLWTVLGEKTDYDYGSHGSDRAGRLIMNGVFRLQDGSAQGVLKSEFQE